MGALVPRCSLSASHRAALGVVSEAIACAGAAQHVYFRAVRHPHSTSYSMRPRRIGQVRAITARRGGSDIDYHIDTEK